MKRIDFILAVGVIPAVAILSFGQVWSIHDVIWDDNCWVLSVYASANLREFLGTAFVELRREQLGVFLYYLIALHKSTNSFYVVVHTINLGTQIFSPVLLYFLVRNLFNGQRLLALFVALGFTAFPLDHELPHVSGMNYRIGLLLAIASLYGTERALAGGHLRRVPMLLALGCAILSYYVFIEATISLEIGRLALVVYMLRRRGSSPRDLVREVLLYWAPFCVPIIPLALYKLLYRPYGIYQGTYETDPLFFLDYERVFKAVAHVAYFPWIALLKDLHYASIWSVMMAIIAGGLSLALLKKLPAIVDGDAGRAGRDAQNSLASQGIVQEKIRVPRAFLVLGIAFLVPPACLFLYAKQPLAGSGFSAHAAMLQIGSAFLIGSALHGLYSLAISSSGKRRACMFLLGLILSLGVFFNNINLDLYRDSWVHQDRFWQAFVARFPSLPEKALFFFDVEDGAYYSDLRNPYDFELHLNLLYATTTDPAHFHKYSVYTKQEFVRRFVMSSKTEESFERIQRESQHWGREHLDPRLFIAVRYRENELLVNREILGRYPNMEYGVWADKDFPALPQPAGYVLRHKLEGFH